MDPEAHPTAPSRLVPFPLCKRGFQEKQNPGSECPVLCSPWRDSEGSGAGAQRVQAGLGARSGQQGLPEARQTEHGTLTPDRFTRNHMPNLEVKG